MAGKAKIKRAGSARKRTGASMTFSAEMRREEAIRLALTLAPLSVIAKRLGVSPTHASRIVNEPDVRARIEAARKTSFEDAKADLRRLTRRAAAVLGEELESRHPPTRVRAADLILSKAGADAARKFDVGVVAGSTDEDLEAEFLALQARRALEGKTEPEGGDGSP